MQKIDRFGCLMKSTDFIVQAGMCFNLDEKISWLCVYRTTNFVCVAMVIVYNGRWVFVLVIFQSMMHIFVQWMQKNNSDKIIAVVYFWSWYRIKLQVIFFGRALWLNNFIDRFSWSTRHTHKSRQTSVVRHPLYCTLSGVQPDALCFSDMICIAISSGVISVNHCRNGGS